MLPNLLFIHIPRSGGTSMRRLLARFYAPDAKLALNSFPGKLEPKDLEERRRLLEAKRPLFAHGQPDRFFCYWKRLLQLEHKKIILLREPVERILSQYRYFLTVHGSDMPLEKYLKKIVHLRNYQTRMIATMMALDNCDRYQNDALVDNALNNLHAYNVILGLTDRFNSTLALVEAELGVDITQYTVYNRTRTQGSYRQEDLDFIQELYISDIQLYGLAKELFEDRLRQKGVTETSVIEVVDNTSYHTTA